MFGRFLQLILVLYVGAIPLKAQNTPNDLLRDIYKELIEINTTDEAGDNTRAANAMAARLIAAGFPSQDIQVLEPHPRKGNLVARYRGSGRRSPLLLLAHLDVVEARREDWTVDPFTLLERDGYFYGRGTSDDKAMAAIWVALFIQLKSEGFEPDRDLILALTADEEGGRHNGVSWLLEKHRDLISAGFAINEGGGGQLKAGKPFIHAVQASEKIYQSYVLEVKNAGGHSSRPTKNNAIYRLAIALSRLEKYSFPVKITEVTAAYYRRMAELTTGLEAEDMRSIIRPNPPRAAVTRLSSSPFDNALIRTTCVPTQLEAGHAENALPQLARAIVNCRILPGDSPDSIRMALVRVVNDRSVSIRPLDVARPSPPSPITSEIMGPIERITEEMWPGVPVVPIMSTGATDGLYLRNAGIPTYGVSGLFSSFEDNRAHGMDERIGVKEVYEGREFLYRLIKAYSQ